MEQAKTSDFEQDARAYSGKLQGGSLKTANHDLQRMKDARKAVKDANEAERDRAARRRNRAYSPTYADMSPYVLNRDGAA